MLWELEHGGAETWEKGYGAVASPLMQCQKEQYSTEVHWDITDCVKIYFDFFFLKLLS